MKGLRISMVIVVLVLAGRTFNAHAQMSTDIYSFGVNGDEPIAGLVQGSDGNFYGTTYGGGAHSAGTIFRVSSSGAYTSLYSFVGSPTDGKYPQGALVQGSDGNFYGTTQYGGTNSCDCGIVFRISSTGNETNLYTFGSVPDDGQQPYYAGLVQGSDGNFYGTTELGGTNGDGTVFRINSSGSETILHSFVGYPDGESPEAGLVQGSDGNFYGTTYGGGEYGGSGHGTVFRISPGGSFTSLYSFVGQPTDGSGPHAGLVQGSDGNFYGTTILGGSNGYGIVFRISSNGNETNLHSFVGYPTDGRSPWGPLVQGSDGNFYGTTIYGGTNANNYGTVFRISPSGSLTILHSFVDFPTDGSDSTAGLVQGSDGNFYGTTQLGGTNNVGAVFRLTVPLTPPANQISAVQISGTNVILTVPSVEGETYQLQFSSSLTPINWSNVAGSFVSNSIGALLTMTNFGGAVGPQGFYRFDITP